MSKQILFFTESFEASVRKALNKFECPIYDSDLAQIENIEFEDEPIYEDLCLLQYFSNLTGLSISMPVSQVGQLSNLKKLTNLEIEFTDSGLVDFAVFSSLNNLNYLGLFGELFSEINYCNIDALKELSQLSEIRIHEFNYLDLTDFPALPSLKRFSCLFGRTLIGIECVSKLCGLKSLELCDVSVDSLDFLMPLDRSIYIDLCALRVRDKVDYNLLNSFPYREISEMEENCN